MKRYIDAIIFDLDGVVTDTAEYHYLAWKQLADEEGIPFTREENENLRGVSRRKSLETLLKGHHVSEEKMQTLMARKNQMYLNLLKNVNHGGLLPGVKALLDDLQNKGIKIAIASASRNTQQVIDRLGIRGQLDVIADGNAVQRPKPAPDIFLYAAQRLNLPPARCLVVEDAASGVQAAQEAGMVVVGIGPQERVGQADMVLPSLEGIQSDDLARAATWRVSEPVFDPARQNMYETIFTQGNGYLGTRGSFEERYPGDIQATLVHGLWDNAPVVFTELVNIPDWTSFDLWVNDKKFRMDRGIVSHYTRYLDLRSGVLHRSLFWQAAPDTPNLHLIFERFPSMADPHIMLLRVRIIPVDGPCTIEGRAMLDSQVHNDGLKHIEILDQQSDETQADLLIHTRYTKHKVGMSMNLAYQGNNVKPLVCNCRGCPGAGFITQLNQDEQLTIDKIVSVYTSRDAIDPLKNARERANLAIQKGIQQLLAQNRQKWDDFWKISDVKIFGDDEAQIAIRHALFQLRIAASEIDDHVSIGAKTLSGFAYRGHVFWDNEIFVLPFFTFTQPQLAHNLLMYRWHTLPGARKNAAKNNFMGAQFPWESAENGDEVTPKWVPNSETPRDLIRIWTGDIEIHITADVAYAIYQYWHASGDEDFWINYGIPIILETAVFWGERVEPDGNRFTIRDVIGPDEYHEHVDNNVFTNYMVRWHLQTALDTLSWLETHNEHKALQLRTRLELTSERLVRWQKIIDNIIILQDPDSGLFEQFDGFFKLREVDWSAYVNATKSMQTLLGIDGANQHQVLKQADVILLLCLFRDRFDQSTWKVNWDYYNSRTDHNYGSSLSPAIHAWAACEIGQIDAAYVQFMRAARADLDDIRGNARDGIHAASAGGLWQALIFGFAGVKIREYGPTVNPHFPSHWQRVQFNLVYRGKLYPFDIHNKKPPVPMKRLATGGTTFPSEG